MHRAKSGLATRTATYRWRQSKRYSLRSSMRRQDVQLSDYLIAVISGLRAISRACSAGLPARTVDRSGRRAPVQARDPIAKHRLIGRRLWPRNHQCALRRSCGPCCRDGWAPLQLRSGGRSVVGAVVRSCHCKASGPCRSCQSIRAARPILKHRPHLPNAADLITRSPAAALTVPTIYLTVPKCLTSTTF